MIEFKNTYLQFQTMWKTEALTTRIPILTQESFPEERAQQISVVEVAISFMSFGNLILLPLYS